MMVKSISPAKILLEVERKFCGLTIPCLTTHVGSPRFRCLHDTGKQTIKDTYFDMDSLLSSRGIWLRKRQIIGNSPVWEAKCRQGGSYNNSMFEEITDSNTITHIVQSITGHSGTPESNFGLGTLASMVTERRSWLVDGQFKIVLDSMDFGHEVGEVELERSIIPPQPQEPTFNIESWKRDITRSMDQQIEEFMERYHWAFRSGTPKGKLTAYFERYC